MCCKSLLVYFEKSYLLSLLLLKICMSNKKNVLDKIFLNRGLIHLFFWIGLFAIFTVLALLNSENSKEAIISYLAFLPSQLLASYFFVYYQFPKLILKKKYALFILSFIVCAYFFSVMARLLSVYIAEPFFRKNFQQESIIEVFSDFLHLTVAYFPAIYVVVFLMLTIKTIKDRFQEKHRFEIIQKEKVKTELKFLKTQIHPHFLFNTLNNLYTLIRIKSDDAQEVVLKLSNMLDYMLYQCNDNEVLLKKEIELIENYIDLESLRYGNKLKLDFTYSLDNQSIKIAPLILVSFVENAFKHGASSNPKNPNISVDLKVKDNRLFFKVYNTKIVDISHKNQKRHGIGNENTQRQLDLNYKNNYNLSIEETDEDYTVILKIKLN